MGAEARLNGSSTKAPIKKSQKIVLDFNMPCQWEFVQVFAIRAGTKADHNTKDKY